MLTKFAAYAVAAGFIGLLVYNTLTGAFEAVHHLLAPTGFFG